MRNLIIPTEIKLAIDAGAILAVSISGGKDSQALLKSVIEYHRAENLTNRIFAIHADLGRAEWKQTPEFVEKLCKELGVELIVVRRNRNGKDMDLLDRWQERQRQLEGTGKPFWSSAKARYCTSDLKAEPINKYLRQFDNVISIEGICWHESKARSEKPRFKVRTELATRKRKALTWNAIIDWSLEDVWSSYGQSASSHAAAFEHYNETKEIASSWNFHPAYAMGNTRLSCSICILANMNDFLNGILHNEELANEIDKMETESGFTFKQGMSIKDARKRILKNQQSQLF